MSRGRYLWLFFFVVASRLGYSQGASPFQQVAGSLKQIQVAPDGAAWGLNSAGSIYNFSPATQSWTQIPGALVEISVGANGVVWGLNAQEEIYRWDLQAQNWTYIPGSLRQISVGADGDVWGINDGDQIYHFDPINQSWQQVPGSLVQIAVGFDAAVWGLNAQQQIYRFNPGSYKFEQVPGFLSQIAVGSDGDVWGINSAQQISHFNTLYQNWENVSGTLVQLSVGSATQVWGLSATGGIYHFDSQSQTWLQVSGALQQIAASSNASVWGLNASGSIYALGATETTPIWKQLPGSLTQVAAGPDGNLWGLNSTGSIYHFNSLIQAWDYVPGLLVQIAVGFAGDVWRLNASGQIWRYNSQGQTWDSVPGNLSYLAVGGDKDVWGLNKQNQIWRYNPSSQNWTNIPGTLTQLSVGVDGTVWGLNYAGQIWRYNPSFQSWDYISGTLMNIAIGSAGNVWGVNPQGGVYRFDSQHQWWVYVPGVTLAQIAVGFDGSVWGVNADGQIYHLNSQAQNWQSVVGDLNQIVAPDDGVLTGLNTATSIFELASPASSLNQILATPLQIVNTVPANGATGVSVQQSISLTFSNQLDPSIIGRSLFTLEDSAGNQVPLQFSYNPSALEVILIPSRLLVPNATYTVNVSSRVHDVVGNPISSGYSLQFQVGPPTSASGTLFPPSNSNPSALTVVGFQGAVAGVSSDGQFTTQIDPARPTFVIAPLPVNASALMAVALPGNDGEELSILSVLSRRDSSMPNPVSRYTRDHEITASTSPGTGFVLDFQTTAEAVLFNSYALCTRDPNAAARILGVIAADPNTTLLATAIQNASTGSNPFQNSDVISAYSAALLSVVSTLTQQSTSTGSSRQAPASTTQARGPEPNLSFPHVRSSLISAQAGASGTPSFQSIDADTIVALPFVLEGGQYVSTVQVRGANFDVSSSGFLLGNAAGWMMRVVSVPYTETEVNSLEQPINDDPGNPDSPGPLNGENAPDTIHPVWIPGNSIFQYFNAGTDLNVVGGWLWNHFTGQSPTLAPNLSIPASQQALYVLRFYSGGFADPSELPLVLQPSTDGGIYEAQNLWFQAEGSVEILRHGADVIVAGGIGLHAPLRDRHLRHAFQYRARIDGTNIVFQIAVAGAVPTTRAGRQVTALGARAIVKVNGA
ncbi:MAG: Ig-like domain-containing protein [Acidobacteriaceae bacterium]|nr:Ig-like domain-containing protein [Acidobacteriaceae bacterium]